MDSCYNERKSFTVDVESIIDNRQTVTITSAKSSNTWHDEICVYVWNKRMKGKNDNMQQVPKLECKKLTSNSTSSGNQSKVVYNCTCSIGKVCRKAYDDNGGRFILLYPSV